MDAYKGAIIDGDSHLYEDLELWSSYLPQAYRKDYGLKHVATPDGRFPIHIGGKRISYGEEYMRPDGTIPKPGSLHEWLKAMKSGGGEHLWVPPPPDVRSGAERLRKLDEFKVEASVVFPSEGITVLPFIDRTDAVNALMTAYNRYIFEHWGFAQQNRIFCTAFLHLDDLHWAVKELDWVLKHGARAIAIPCGPAQKHSPADPMFDAFWARLNEAQGLLGLHIGQATYMHSLLQEWGEPLLPPVTEKSAWDWMNTMGETPIVHTLSSLIYLNFFARFPKIRALSAENGAEWVPAMLQRMDKMRGFARNGRWPCGQLKERPSDIFKRNVFVVPYPEDNLRAIIDSVGSCECLVMGSDYPHAEGVSEPRLFMADMQGITPDEERKVMYENGRRMLAGIR